MTAESLGVCQADARDPQAVNQPGKGGMGGCLGGGGEVFIGFLPEALHRHNGLPVGVQMEDICVLVDKAGAYEFLQGGLGEAVDV